MTRYKQVNGENGILERVLCIVNLPKCIPYAGVSPDAKQTTAAPKKKISKKKARARAWLNQRLLVKDGCPWPSVDATLRVGWQAYLSS